jgi:NDP-sugar pyrophosphorylase family protein
MGPLGQLSAKTALLAFDQPILGRLLNQIREAGFQKIVISTGPAHLSQLSELVSNYVNEVLAERWSSIQVINNSAHAEGPLEAFAEVHRLIETPRCLLCLGDMFYRDNPFDSLAVEVSRTDTCLGVADVVEPLELAQGGIVHCRGQEIVAVVERPQPARGGELRWSGLALFSRELLDVLPVFLLQAPTGSPVGNLFEFCRQRGYILRAVWGPDFVNINSPNHLLLAALYAAIESWQGQTGLLDAFAEAATRLRHALAASRSA